MTLIWYWIVANGEPLLRGALLLFVGLPLVRVAAALTARALRGRMTESAVMLVRKVVSYTFTTIVLIMLLHELGFKLAPLLGAAGIAGVAVGFASKTSLSNLISGLFLVWEKAFQVGDVLEVGDTLGVVHAIDLLSVKLRRFDNRVVRIPNETLVNGKFTNVTRFPIRRFDIDLHVAYKEDVEQVTRVLGEIAAANPYSLDEPEPLVLFKGFGDSALQFLLGVWFEKDDMQALRGSLLREIKERFEAEGIEIPFPHRTISIEAAASPFPVHALHEEGTVPDPEPETIAAPEPAPTRAAGRPPDYAPER